MSFVKNVQRDEETWQAQQEDGDGDGDGDGLFLRETLVMTLRVELRAESQRVTWAAFTIFAMFFHGLGLFVYIMTKKCIHSGYCIDIFHHTSIIWFPSNPSVM